MSRERTDHFGRLLIASQVEDWKGIVDRAKDRALHLAGNIVANVSVPLAVRLIVNQSISDLMDLLDDVERGSGRAAMRSARALIEHAINLHTIVASDVMADRYLDHLDLGPVVLYEHGFPDELPNADYIRSMRHTLRGRARDAKAKVEAAVSKYGDRFARDWAGVSLYSRAQAQDQERLYDFYRVASMTTHGTAGSVATSRRAKPDGFAHRVGLDTESVPYALYYALLSLLDILSSLKDAHADAADYASMEASIQELGDEWVVVHQVMTIASDLVFEESRGRTILAISRTGAVRWYLEDPQDEKTWHHGTQPPLTEFERNLIPALVEDFQHTAPEFDDPSTMWIAIRLPYTIAPKIDSRKKGIPATAIHLYPDDEFMDWATDYTHDHPGSLDWDEEERDSKPL